MKVTLFTQQTCSYSNAAKEYLTTKGVSFEEKDVKADIKNLEELRKKSQGFSGVPVAVVVDDTGKETVLKGFTKEKYDEVFSTQSGEKSTPAYTVFEQQETKAEVENATPPTPSAPTGVQTPPPAPTQRASSSSQSATEESDQTPTASTTTPPTAQQSTTPQQPATTDQAQKKAQEELQGIMNQLEGQATQPQTPPQPPQTPANTSNGAAPKPAAPPIPDFPTTK